MNTEHRIIRHFTDDQIDNIKSLQVVTYQISLRYNSTQCTKTLWNGNVEITTYIKMMGHTFFSFNCSFNSSWLATYCSQNFQTRLQAQSENPSPTIPVRGPEIMHKSSKELYKAVAKQFGITCKMSDQCR